MHPEPEQPQHPLIARGVICVLIGIAMLIGLLLSPGATFHPSIAAIPIAIGVAYFGCFFYARKGNRS